MQKMHFDRALPTKIRGKQFDCEAAPGGGFAQPSDAESHQWADPDLDVCAGTCHEKTVGARRSLEIEKYNKLISYNCDIHIFNKHMCIIVLLVVFDSKSGNLENPNFGQC